MANEKTYAKGLWVEKKPTSFGDIIKLSVKTADFAEFLQQYTNEKGYCNIDVLNSKEGDKLYAVLNDFKPQGGTNSSQQKGSESGGLPF